MNQRLRTFCAVGLLALSAGIASVADGGADTYSSYTGIATARHTAKFLYRENHVLRYHDGKIAERVVLYSCGDGSAFARKTVSYADALAPDFLLEDASNGMREGVRTAAGGRAVFFRAGSNEAEKTSPLPRVSGLVADTGFDEFVRANWQPLMSGKRLSMRFLVPSRLQEMGFEVQHVKSERLDGVPVEVFSLKLSGVLGWALPGIDVYYGANDHVLMRYVGISDLRDGSHGNFQTEIVFRPSDRKLADDQAMANALRARLAPCR